jgi:hypothetical protein
MSLTPEQFALLATKEDLKELKETMATKDDFQVILSAVDGLSKNVVKFQQELSSNQGAHDRIQEQVDNHDMRIGKLETSIA